MFERDRLATARRQLCQNIQHDIKPFIAVDMEMQVKASRPEPGGHCPAIRWFGKPFADMTIKIAGRIHPHVERKERPIK